MREEITEVTVVFYLRMTSGSDIFIFENINVFVHTDILNIF